MRRPRRRPVPAPVAVVSLVALVVAGLAAVGPPRPADATPRPAYRPPVVAPVVDPFRPPPQPWMAGNRGLEYATVPGTAVAAIGPGVVTFAGPVAGALHVTVRHPDGLRSTASHLAAIRVGAGDRVAAGSVVGIAGPRLHLGVRRGDAYLDPASLWGRTVGGGRVHLVAEPEQGGARPVPSVGGPRPGPPHRATSGARIARVLRAAAAAIVGVVERPP